MISENVYVIAIISKVKGKSIRKVKESQDVLALHPRSWTSIDASNSPPSDEGFFEGNVLEFSGLYLRFLSANWSFYRRRLSNIEFSSLHTVMFESGALGTANSVITWMSVILVKLSHWVLIIDCCHIVCCALWTSVISFLLAF